MKSRQYRNFWKTTIMPRFITTIRNYPSFGEHLNNNAETYAPASIYPIKPISLTHQLIIFSLQRQQESKRDIEMINRRLNNIPPKSTTLNLSIQKNYFKRRFYLRMQQYSWLTVRSSSYHTKSYQIEPQMDIIVWVDQALVTILLRNDLLPYTSQRMTTMQLRWVSKSMY